MAGVNDYVIAGELTDRATLSQELLNKITVGISEIIPIRNNAEENANDSKASAPSSDKQYHQRFLEFTYPGSGSNRGIILPGVVVHHELGDNFNKTAVMFGIPQHLVRLLEPKISSAGGSCEFKDKRISSDEKYWWTRGYFNEAPQDKEYIRMLIGDEEEYFGSFPDFFAEYPTSVLANITCSIKMTCEITKTKDKDGNMVARDPKKGDLWRAGLKISMVTPYDVIDVPTPQSGNVHRSIAGKKDVAKSALLNMKRSA